MKLKYLAMACAISASFSIGSQTYAGSGEVVFIHSGDIHGHLVPRANVRSDSTPGHMEGGLARMATVIQQIRQENLGKTLYFNTGDTVQGSAEALFTKGQALIDVVNMLGVDAHAPGNWDFLYGPARFEATFKGNSTTAPLANWNAMAANLYYTNQTDSTAVCGVKNASGVPLKRVLPPYMVKTVNGVKVGVIGFTTARAIAAISPTVTAGYLFNDGKVELPCYINQLRSAEQVDLVVLISELEMGRDIALAETYPGVDLILNSDMHEKTLQPIITPTGTLIVEEGQDGTMLGEMHFQVSAGHTMPGDGKVTWTWTPHIIIDTIRENRFVAAKVKQVRTPFVMGTFVPGQAVTVGGNTTTLLRPIDEVVAYSNVALHRSNFMDEDMAGVVEGSSHDLIADAMRWSAGSDAAALRGFRYGTHIPVGSAITMQDIYHYIPIAAKVGRSPKACGYDLKFQAENASDGTFNADATKWTGGWLFGYSNVSYDLDACAGYGIDGATGAVDRATNMKVGGNPVNISDKYNAATQACFSGAAGYSVAGYWYNDDPGTINNCAPCRGRLIQTVKTDGTVVDVAVPTYNATTGVTTVAYTLPTSTDLLDISEAVVNYLRAPSASGGIGGLVSVANLPLHRLNVKRLPNVNPYSFKTIQPLRGATAATCPAAPL
ncbi:bifunctional metallophosphatase/5'-nucleotidase [Sulfurirhabdus autotrophica]|uniref:2',3'-cyclic-nucleotide 2'-phosphodiesterase (5'-nucleotidase family) n=1 Tax=Sulfurirhabdus autotrophica TaxID=1706046 RepID=A0A4V2W357_9PROT|nr:5'-nucleotidase C-terminal domain-containing protein [Sulfurirhabdus autotrophica]TCV90649.1 2',3'-cyclic-nucleotide 2'-phosphodiesterase (5'-nucleotidase family) [Sulfurirhabdus autotrophica]